MLHPLTYALTKVWQCPCLKGLRPFFYLTHAWSTWSLQWVRVHWKELMLTAQDKPGSWKSDVSGLHALIGWSWSVTQISVTHQFHLPLQFQVTIGFALTVKGQLYLPCKDNFCSCNAGQLCSTRQLYRTAVTGQSYLLFKSQYSCVCFAVTIVSVTGVIFTLAVWEHLCSCSMICHLESLWPHQITIVLSH